jgi:hypothetical protein
MKIIKLFNQSIAFVVIVSLIALTLFVHPEVAAARGVRGGTRINVNGNRHVNRDRKVNRRDNNKRDININRNTNVNIDRDVNVRRHGRHGYHGNYHDHDDDDGIGVGAAIAIGIAGLAVGSIVTAAAMPPSCNMVNVNGTNYKRCGDTWYQPQYSGSEVNYVVVNPPR